MDIIIKGKQGEGKTALIDELWPNVRFNILSYQHMLTALQKMLDRDRPITLVSIEDLTPETYEKAEKIVKRLRRNGFKFNIIYSIQIP